MPRFSIFYEKNNWNIVFRNLVIVNSLQKEVFPSIKGMIRLFLCPVKYYNSDKIQSILEYIFCNIYGMRNIHTKQDVEKLYCKIILNYIEIHEQYSVKYPISPQNFYRRLSTMRDMIYLDDNTFIVNTEWVELFDADIFSLILINHFSKMKLDDWIIFKKRFVDPFYHDDDFIHDLTDCRDMVYSSCNILLKIIDEAMDIDSQGKLKYFKPNIDYMNIIMHCIIKNIRLSKIKFIPYQFIEYINENILFQLIKENIISSKSNYDFPKNIDKLIVVTKSKFIFRELLKQKYRTLLIN